MIGKCKLCGIENTLKNSHILPEFLYKPVYDDKHRYIQLTGNLRKTASLKQKGIREYLLCGDCETVLSKYEGHAKEKLENAQLLPEVNEIRTITGINYTYFKLFQLSVLWRCSVSTLWQFSQVNLGKYEDEIRQMILNQEPGEPNEFPCVMATPQSTRKMNLMLWTPRKIKHGAHTSYWLMFEGVFWVYFVSKYFSKNMSNQIYLTKNGDLPIGKFPWSEEEAIMLFGSSILKKLSMERFVDGS